MSSPELRRVEVLARVKSKDLKLTDAAELMEVSYRQAKRLWRRYRKQGAKGLKHGSAGRRSNRAKPEKFREKVLRLIRAKYSGPVGERFGPTLAAEHLASEDGLEVDAETLRRWMLKVGLWSRERKHKPHRKRRERKAHFGELVQMDGSFEKWLEERGPAGCLMNMVDDATGTTLNRLGEQETTWAAAGVLRAWIASYGVPMALYTDWKNVYVREPNAKERVSGAAPLTQFGAMCGRLGIRIIAASSAQAKGRVERNHGTHQDRLVKKLRRRKIASLAAANEFLQAEYLPEHNRRFARPAAAEEDYHGPAPGKRALDEIFRMETERTLSNDWVVRHENRLYQVKRESSYAPARSKVTVCEWEDGRLEIRYRGKRLGYEEIAQRPAKVASPVVGVHQHHRPKPPQADHPWRQAYQEMRPRSRRSERAGQLWK
jgi:transposase